MSEIPSKLIEALRNQELVPFVGSGMSLDVNYDEFPGWNDVFQEMAAELDQAKKQKPANAVRALAEAGFVFKAAEVAEESLGIAEFSRVIERNYDKRSLPDGSCTDLPEAIWALQPKLVVTTNYDQILEQTNSNSKPVCNADRSEVAEFLTANGPTSDRPTVWHLHGLASRKDSLILSPSQYKRLYEAEENSGDANEAALDRFEDLLSQRTLLFIGFGMRDSYVMEIVARVLKRFQGFSGTHYALLKRDEVGEQLWKNFGIQSIPYDDHGEPLRKLVQEIGAHLVAPVSDEPAAGDEEEEPEIDQPGELEPYPLPRLPTFDQALILNRFFGREGLMEKFQDLLRGLIERSQGDSPTGAAATQLQWVHGFGGMGKSWYLRKAYIDAQKHIPKIRVALVDWAHTDWRDPLNDHPKTPEDLMEPIATRLAQLAGIEAIQPFREAKLRVANARRDRHRLRARFKEQMDRLQREGNTDDAMLQLLSDESLRSDDKDEQKKRLDELRANRVEYETLFGTWCQSEAVDVSDLDATSRPTNLLLDGLVRSIRKSANEMPLLLMLDTCEVISHRPHLEYWLRRIVSQLCDGKTPTLIQIVSRLKPDAGTVPGRRKGWREISDRLVSVVDFNADNCLLSRAEIEHGLQRLEPKVDETEELSKQVFQVTLGVPLAVGSLFDMHLDQSNVLQELGSFDSEKHSLNETEAVQKVIEEVSGRMLLHLHESERPESEEDLRSIVALALLPSLDEEVLSRFWDCKPWQRLLDLASRYSLLAGGDLHLRVREYLRRYWRDGYRPDCFDEVMDTLARILEQLPTPEDQAFGSESWMISRMRQLNLSFWQEGWKAKDQAARLLAVAIAYDEKVPELVDLILEFADSDTGGRKLAQHLQTLQSRGSSPYENSAIRSWLSKSESLTSWSKLESACLKIGIELVEKAKTPEDYIEKFLRLEASVQRFDNWDAPYRDQLASSYFTIGYAIWPNNVDSPIVTDSHAVSWHQAVEAAYRRTIEFEPGNQHAWNNLGGLLTDLEQYEESEQAFRKAVQLDEKHVFAWNGLGTVLHAMNRFEESEAAYRKSIELDEKYATPWYGLGNLLKNHLDRFEESEQAYRKAIELDEKDATPWIGLGNLYSDHLNRIPDSVDAFKKALKIDDGSEYSRLNLIFVCRDLLGDRLQAKVVHDEIKDSTVWRDTQALHHALFSAYDSDEESLWRYMEAALELVAERLPPSTWDDWCRASAVLLHLGYGEELLKGLRERKVDERLSSWFLALQTCMETADRETQLEDPDAERYFRYITNWKAKLPERPSADG